MQNFTSVVTHFMFSSLVKLDKEFGLKSGNLSGDNCIEVRWNKAESGACFVKYDVTFKNASGHNLHTQTGHNIGGMNVCNLAAYSSITDVQLVVSFKSTSRTVTAKVSRPEITTPPITTPPPTTGREISSLQYNGFWCLFENSQVLSMFSFHFICSPVVQFMFIYVCSSYTAEHA